MHHYHCVARNCFNSAILEDLDFFSLPEEMERADDWLKTLGRKDLLGETELSKLQMLVCANHFSEDMFDNTGKNLLNHAIPRIHYKQNYLLQEEAEDFLYFVKEINCDHKKEPVKSETQSTQTDFPPEVVVDTSALTMLQGQIFHLNGLIAMQHNEMEQVRQMNHVTKLRVISSAYTYLPKELASMVENIVKNVP